MRALNDEFLDIFRIEYCPIDTPGVPITLSFFSGGLFGMLEEIVALTVVNVAEMFDGPFPFRQGGLKLSFEAGRLKAALFGVFDKLCG